MQTLPLLETLEFRDDRPLAKPLLVEESGRVLRFTLKPNQRVLEHCAPHSPVHIVVPRGEGMFAGEVHAVRALDEPLVFVAFLHKAQGVPERRAAPKEDTYLTWFM